MLKLNPTQIRLEKKDLDWHASRHNERRNLQTAAVPSKDMTKSMKKETPRKRRHGKFPDESAPIRHPLSSMHQRACSGPDSEIFSDEPVPRGSRAFWDRVLAEAGTPARVQSASRATATIVQPSDDFLNSTHSSKASVESVSAGEHSESEAGGSPPYREAGGSSAFSTQYPSESSNSTRGREANAEKAEQQPPSTQTAQSSSHKARFSIFSWRRKTRPELDRSSDSIELGHANHSLSGSMAVDGASDRRSSLYRDMSAAHCEGSSSDPDDGLYGNRRDRRTLSQTQASNEDHVQEDHAETSTRAASRAYYPPPRALGHARNVSGTVPRSSLYISETAPSSSPERPPRTPATSNARGMESRGLLSQPPRRPRMYRQRSQTYSYVESEGDPDMPQMDGPSAIQSITKRIPSLVISHESRSSSRSPLGESGRQGTPRSVDQKSDTWLPSSPPELPGSITPFSNRSLRTPQGSIGFGSHHSHSSNLSSHSRVPSSSSPITSSPYYQSIQPTLPRRNLSPLAPPTAPHRAQRIVSPSLILPPPFSSTARTVSSSNAYPPSSPASPHTPPPTRHPSTGNSPTTTNAPSSHLRIPIYNDNIDPQLQPQTPVGLPRHGVPSMSSAHHTAAYTMPVGMGLGRFANQRAVAEWQAFATPTRRGRGRRGVVGSEMDQENQGQGGWGL
ncbi:hypothetical protein ACLMJK_007537 [Lecanora helva]